MTTLTFTVIGLPGAQGSKRHVGRGIMVESSKKVAPWRQDVVAAAVKASADVDAECFRRPVIVDAHFHLTRPKGHYRTGANAHLLRDDAPRYVTSRAVGDLDKLLRSTFDALTTAGIWADDSLVVMVTASKTYGETAGALIRIKEIA